MTTVVLLPIDEGLGEFTHAASVREKTRHYPRLAAWLIAPGTTRILGITKPYDEPGEQLATSPFAQTMNYPVDLHSHTVASTHAYSTIHDYIAIAKSKGVRLFANTDHGPAMPDAPHYWHFVNLRVLPRIVDGVGILRGIEANILDESGRVDAEGRMRDSLDIFLCGFHEAAFAPSTREINTKAMVNAIRGGQIDIITHPGNTAFPIDIERVVRAAAESGVALEINNSSFNLSRKGSKPNCRAIVEAARDLGATLSLGSDAHVAFDLGNFSEADQLVREAHFPEERLLNTSPRKLLAFLESRGRAPIPEFADW